MSTKQYDVIIVGGGITGLTTALYLSRGGARVALVERSERLGGQIRSYAKDGFTFESGPNTGILNAVEVVELFDLISTRCTVETAHEESKSRLILHRGTFKALPTSLRTAITTPLFSLCDKFRVLFEPFRRRGENPNESIGDFATRRLGRSFTDYAVDPFVSGIYAGDVSRLVTRFALPKLYNLEQTYGSFIRGTIKRKDIAKAQKVQGVTKEIFSACGGLESITKAIAEMISDSVDVFTRAEGCEVRTGETAIKGLDVTFTQDGENVALNAANVVTTTGAYTLAELLPDVSEELLEPITSLLYAGIIEVAIGYRNYPRKLAAFGGLIPSKENRKILGVLYPSACFDDRSPKGGAVLSVFMGGTKRTEILALNDAEITAVVLEELRSTMGVEQAPDLVEVFRHPKAIPQYYASTERRLEAVEKIEQLTEGLTIGGNLKDGIGLSDRVKQGRAIADALLLRLA